MSLATIIIVLASVAISALFLEMSLKLGMHAFSGFVGTSTLNIFLGFFNLHILYNLIDTSIAGIFRIPELAILFLYHIIL